MRIYIQRIFCNFNFHEHLDYNGPIESLEMSRFICIRRGSILCDDDIEKNDPLINVIY